MVCFSDNRFGDTDRPQGVGTHELVGELNRWWKSICSQQNIDPEDKRLKNADYYIMELGKNALEHADGGEIKVIFESSKITAIVSDLGQGFDDLNDAEYRSSSQYGHGLFKTRKYADEFFIESGGRKYGKIKSKIKLVDIEVSDVTTGSKITFIKNFE